MATRLTGALGPFVLQIMQWTSYAERMEEYLLANGLEDNRKKVAVLLSTNLRFAKRLVLAREAKHQVVR